MSRNYYNFIIKCDKTRTTTIYLWKLDLIRGKLTIVFFKYIVVIQNVTHCHYITIAKAIQHIVTIVKEEVFQAFPNYCNSKSLFLDGFMTLLVKVTGN